MRQRKVKNERERLEALEHLQIKNAAEIKGSWGEFLALKNLNFDGQIYVEIGCGRGHYLAGLSASNPKDFYLGIESRSSVVLRALELIDDRQILNVLFIPEYMKDATEYFVDGEVSGIFLNFSDPWPKARHSKRRLTHRNNIRSYKKILKPGGFIEFKTDSEDFFNFTLEECKEEGLIIEECTNDLHNSNYSARNITSQYEDRFLLLGKSICYCKMRTAMKTVIIYL
jgi:tRNA (guanine-N(7)-)-methyltransferase